MPFDSFVQENPDVYLLCLQSAPDVEQYLRHRKWIDDGEIVLSFESAGEGNMNYTYRVETNRRSFILKQSVPWVAKYPTIEAPWDRIIRETRFYQIVSATDTLSCRMPTLFDVDITSRIACFEDLGDGQDVSTIYSGTPLDVTLLEEAARWLSTLHATPIDSQSSATALPNRDMRELNHEHIFHYPLLPDNGLDLEAITPGLQEEAAKLIHDANFVKTVIDLGERYYLQDGLTLLHGDFFPGSWYQSKDGLKIIDPEFAFFGHAEFDFAVMLAHLLLAEQPPEKIQIAVQSYSPAKAFNWDVSVQLIGVEIMRRLIGVAQLPLTYGIETKRALLELARNCVLSPKETDIFRQCSTPD